MNKTLLLANPRGFCAGVERAIHIVERALTLFGAPIYVRHEIVHNRFIIEQLKAKGVIFIEELNEVPAGATLIYSAHGVSQSVHQEALQRGFRIFDATCPLVSKVHHEVRRLADEGYQIVMIGHKKHPEVEGTVGQIAQPIQIIETLEDAYHFQALPDHPLAYVSQTTLSVDETAAIVEVLKNRFPNIKAPHRDDICYATQNRQDAVKQLAQLCDGVIVIGSSKSSNSNRLREVAVHCGVDAIMVDDANELPEHFLSNKTRIGITAGASAPEKLVFDIIHVLKQQGFHDVQEIGAAEKKVSFILPKELREA
ncbi:MAG: 4-hydroxy-3-methylbut-2-enyl diphosphate reductase [Neisseriaceae bacterium]|nr:4-hydroxy-3-methylbut-2-enyl diphosphate reductase [Neisseriaceae bacterium]